MNFFQVIIIRIIQEFKGIFFFRILINVKIFWRNLVCFWKVKELILIPSELFERFKYV